MFGFILLLAKFICLFIFCLKVANFHIGFIGISAHKFYFIDNKTFQSDNGKLPILPL